MNMTSDYRDPLIDLLNSDPTTPSIHDDIQMINRGGNATVSAAATTDHAAFNQPPLTPLLNQQQLYTTSGSSNNGFDFDHHLEMNPTSPQQQQQPQVASPPRKKRNTRSQTKAQQEQQQKQQPEVSTAEPEIIDPATSIFGDGSESSASEYFQPTPVSPNSQQQLIAQDFQLMNNKFSGIHNPTTHFEQHLPPLQPLSESVIPHGISFQPLILPHDPRQSLTARQSNENSSQQQHEHSGSGQGAAGGNQALRKRKESSGPKTRPAFVMKIWSMVNDPANHDYIRWNDDGKTFQVFQREDFMKIILPKYFKHNNFASFVRQLNMYGWHKVQDINNGTLNQSCDKNGPDEIWQFENPNFIRDREDLLDKIIRNKSSSNQDDINGSGGVSFNNLNNAANLSLILQELETIKMNQYAISEDLRRVRQDNKMLWQENYLNRERNQVQGRTLDKILKFLSVIYGNNANQLLNGQRNGSNVPNVNLNGNANNSVAPYRSASSPFIPRSQSQPPPEDYFQQQFHESGQAASSNNFDVNDATTTNNFANGESEKRALHRPRLMLTNRAHSRRPSIARPKSTPEGSIEEIIRSYSNGRNSDANAHKMYQQLINNQEPSPRPDHNFPQELGLPDTPRNYDELEKNITNQGHSIQQVQDWIERLAQEQHANGGASNTNDDDDFDVNEFLREAATPGSVVNSPVVITPGSNNSNGSSSAANAGISNGHASGNSNSNSANKKRSIHEVNDGNDF
ncbi:Heat shock transcription factor [Candida viswanathii]|uniref:Heat shock transcription factor n=1 Tax=Candida viswanathii TaxID=5486 RepID=A0A367YDN8_9ASCO|nr:Heat shock transcription factor [Candida viswanathii]